MRVIVSGSTGLIGSALVKLLNSKGHSVTPLVRGRAATGKACWDPAAGSIDEAALEGHDAVVHLAGKGIASERWSEKVKAELHESRVKGTKLLCDALASLSKPPSVLVSASAIGFYGDRGDERLQEDSWPGSDFLADMCRAWEEATDAVEEKGTRVVNLRIGVVLSTSGGALQKMLTPFKMGLGGNIGSGRQYFSWVSLDDICGIIDFALNKDDLRGPLNGVSPNPVTNAEFTKVLGKVLGRPTIFPMPDFAARLAFGEMADALLLSSQRVEPAKLLAAGYTFRYADLESALRHELSES